MEWRSSWKFIRTIQRRSSWLATLTGVYDFALPPLLLHTLFTGSTKAIKKWFSICPRNCISVLDTHDGIGVIDVAAGPNEPDKQGLLTSSELAELVETIPRQQRGRESRGNRHRKIES